MVDSSVIVSDEEEGAAALVAVAGRAPEESAATAAPANVDTTSCTGTGPVAEAPVATFVSVSTASIAALARAEIEPSYDRSVAAVVLF